MPPRKETNGEPQTGDWYRLRVRERFLQRDGSPPRERLFDAGEELDAMRFSRGVWLTHAQVNRAYALTDDQVDVIGLADDKP
jgi:hypothetical protein